MDHVLFKRDGRPADGAKAVLVEVVVVLLVVVVVVVVAVVVVAAAPYCLSHNHR